MVTDVVTIVVLQPSEIASYEAGFYYEVVDRTIYYYEFHPIPQAYLSADKTLTSTSTQKPRETPTCRRTIPGRR